MASKNNINKPKYTTQKNHRTRQNAIKRAQRERNGTIKPARSERNDPKNISKSAALELYFNNKINTNGNTALTTKTLSKKREKKIERMIKYVERRNPKINDDDDMDIETKRIREVKQTDLGKLKDALWKALGEDWSFKQNLVSTGQGTTLGSASFA